MAKIKASKENNSNDKNIGVSQVLNREYGGRKLGIVIASFVSLITLLVSLPPVSWIYIVNLDALYEKFKLSAEAAGNLKGGYSLFNLLSFVQHSRQGSVGLYAMILLLLMTAAVCFHAVFLLRVILNLTGRKGNLGLYGIAQSAMLFSVFTAGAAAGYVSFANNRFGGSELAVSPVVFVVLALGIAGYICVKVLERTEWKLYHEHGFLTELRRNWVLFVMLIPAAVYFLINNYLPMMGVYYAFTNFNFRDGLWASPFTGLANFEFLLKADLFRLTRNTVLYNIVFIGLGNILQVIFAVFVSRVTVKWFKKGAQTLMFMPYFVSFVILQVIVYNVFEYNYGVINSALVSVTGDLASRIDFYNTPSYWPFLITLFYMWKNIGYGMVVYLAAIMSIDTEFYDAAKVDGANVFQQIRYITVPLLMPTFIILLLYALGSIMKGQFELFYQMVGTNGVLFNITDIFDTYVYRITMTRPLSIGLGTAAGLYQSLFGFVIVMLTNFAVKKKNPDYALF